MVDDLGEVGWILGETGSGGGRGEGLDVEFTVDGLGSIIWNFLVVQSTYLLPFLSI